MRLYVFYYIPGATYKLRADMHTYGTVCIVCRTCNVGIYILHDIILFMNANCFSIVSLTLNMNTYNISVQYNIHV